MEMLQPPHASAFKRNRRASMRTSPSSLTACGARARRSLPSVCPPTLLRHCPRWCSIAVTMKLRTNRVRDRSIDRSQPKTDSVGSDLFGQRQVGGYIKGQCQNGSFALNRTGTHQCHDPWAVFFPGSLVVPDRDGE